MDPRRKKKVSEDKTLARVTPATAAYLKGDMPG